MNTSVKLRSPALAIAWEIWSRSRYGIITVGISFLFAAAINWIILRNSSWSETASIAGYIFLAGALFATFGFFHFTEGRRKGGFGSFPQRLFNLPISTFWLVALPMVYGSTSVLVVYLAAAGLIFAPLGRSLPILWPCLYLVASLAMFQTIIWSIPERRYLKILCLSLAATAICFAWMFFLPHIIEGTLGELGYQGSPRSFLSGLMIALFLVVPAACAISYWRIRQQRHGEESGRSRVAAFCESASSRLFHRTKTFRSAGQAVFWHEWRRTGFILPIAVAAILAMTCIPSWLSGPLSGKATMGVLTWVFASPLILAPIIGCGFSKFDFWNPDLKINHFAAVRPFSAGNWVAIKLQVGLLSVVITWFLVLFVSFFWFAHAGDFGGLDQLRRQLRFYYTVSEIWQLLVFGSFTALMMSWRFLIAGLPIGLSAHKGWYYAVNTFCALALATLLFLIIWRSDHSDHPLHLYNLWPWIIRMPFLLAVAIIAKVSLAAWAWMRVRQLRMLGAQAVVGYFCAWSLATALLIAGTTIAFPNTPWLRLTLSLLLLLLVPLASPALAMLALQRNRCQP